MTRIILILVGISMEADESFAEILPYRCKNGKLFFSKIMI